MFTDYIQLDTGGQAGYYKRYPHYKYIMYGYYKPQNYTNMTTFATNNHLQYNTNIFVFQTINNAIHKYLFNETENYIIMSTPQAYTFMNMGLVSLMLV